VQDDGMSAKTILYALCVTSIAGTGAAAAGPRQSDEVIVIDEKPPKPAVEARPVNYSARKAPPYSDAAIEQDAWTRAWLLLDIDPRGAVTRFKFLKRPGYDLEDVAARQVFGLRFEPALDARGKPQRTWMIWLIEWPSYGWLIDRLGVASGMPPVIGFPPRRMDAYVPCRGSGPMNLGSIHPAYKDCSAPNLTRRHFAAQPWLYPRRAARR
jgi:hypothetical protein